MKFEYVYFVSYSHKLGFGMTEIKRLNPINTFKDLMGVSEVIRTQGVEEVVILNWKEIKE